MNRKLLPLVIFTSLLFAACSGWARFLGLIASAKELNNKMLADPDVS